MCVYINHELSFFIHTIFSIYSILFFHCFSTFSSNMRAFGLSKELVLEFIKRQADIANLREGKQLKNK